MNMNINMANGSDAYIVQFTLIFLAPALMAASCYMAMGRVVLHATPLSARSVKNLWVPPRWMTPIFVTCDVIAFLIQVFGAISAISKVASTAQRGYSIMKVGLVIQLLYFGFFIIVSLRFYFISQRFQNPRADTRWKKLLMAINTASALIFVRFFFFFISLHISKRADFEN
ncbi:hypothetical protein OCU04_002797 [Sclerotinia nivalis]|uniref:RTA1 domain protein n=1 Tax=Sclerotinia nivalis TaxID=352851 RepID=A0A9X0DQJ5_9HELO|nr:hypothetical protein OCU04_002797 [Sclerotinia nivalis]